MSADLKPAGMIDALARSLTRVPLRTSGSLDLDDLKEGGVLVVGISADGSGYFATTFSATTFEILTSAIARQLRRTAQEFAIQVRRFE